MATLICILLLTIGTVLLVAPGVPRVDHFPRLPKFESRRVKDHRRCLASIARLERELGMESTEQLRETLFGTPAPVRLPADERGRVVTIAPPKQKPHISTSDGQQIVWQPDGRGVPADWYAKYRAQVAQQASYGQLESSDDLEVF